MKKVIHSTTLGVSFSHWTFTKTVLRQLPSFTACAFTWMPNNDAKLIARAYLGFLDLSA